MIELCAKCMKPINTRTESYYTANYEGISERYYLHPMCYGVVVTGGKLKKADK